MFGRRKDARPQVVLEDLLQAILQSLVSANRGMSEKALSAVRETGFTGGYGDNWGTARTIKAHLPGGGDDSGKMLEVPVLSLVPLPYLNVREAVVEFTADIELETEERELTSPDPQGGTQDVRLTARISRSAGSTGRHGDASPGFDGGQVKFQLKLSESDLPGGWAPTLNLMNNRITLTSGTPRKRESHEDDQ